MGFRVDLGVRDLTFRRRSLAPLILILVAMTLLQRAPGGEVEGPLLAPASTPEADALNTAAEATAPEADQRGLVDAAANEQFVLPPEQHPWGRFAPGAWRTLRITAVAADQQADQPAETVVVQTEVLRAIDDDRYTLDVQATVEIGGKSLVGNWRQRQLSFALDRAVTRIVHKSLGESSAEVGAFETPCAVWELAYEVDAISMVDRVYYNGQIAPFVLLRESVEQVESTARPPQVVRTELVGRQLPYVIRDQSIQCDCRRRTTRGAKGRSVEIAFVTDAIPGGEAAAWSTDWNAQGNRVRSSRSELVDYGKTWVEPRRALLPRRRVRQQRRQDRRTGNQEMAPVPGPR